METWVTKDWRKFRLRYLREDSFIKIEGDGYVVALLERIEGDWTRRIYILKAPKGARVYRRALGNGKRVVVINPLSSLTVVASVTTYRRGGEKKVCVSLFVLHPWGWREGLFTITDTLRL